MGVEIAQMALLCGADDAGSTMMEENVVSASGTSKISASEVELQNTIIRAGFSPQRRDSDYQYLGTEINEKLIRNLPSPIPLQ
jgi:cyclic dehypoxanthinyl futalosine synthase